ncbi:hypothetical protein [Achromobacter aloeverae]
MGQDTCCTPATTTAIASLGTAEAVAGRIKTPIRIMQMNCPTEERLIRDKLAGISSVKELDFNLMQRVLTVVYVPDGLPPVLDAIRSLGYTPEVHEANGKLARAEEVRKPWWPLALAGLAAVLAEVAGWVGLHPAVPAVLALLAVVGSGLTTYKKGWVALRNQNFNINALMSIAVTGALILGQWPEAAMVMVLFAVAELIEARSLDRARCISLSGNWARRSERCSCCNTSAMSNYAG